MKMKIADRLENINEYYFSSKLREIARLNAEGRDVINLGIGSPDLAPHQSVIDELIHAAARSDVHAYQSYKGLPALRNAIARWYDANYQVQLDPDTEVLPLIGSKEGIMHICMTYLNEGDKALVPDPGYPTYASAVLLAGAVPVAYSLTKDNNWFPDFDELDSLAENGIRLMFINYPHMPTGKLPTKELFNQLIAFTKKHDILLVHDNPYSFILNTEPMSILASPGAMEHAIELNSLSKSHNMAGWRVGMIVGKEDRINEILKFKSNMDSGMFMPIQLAAAKALELGKEWFDSLNEVYKDRKNAAESLLKNLGCRIEASQSGMFVWAQIPSGYKDAFGFSDMVLKQASVFITPGGIFGKAGKDYIRISLCSQVSTFEKAIERCADVNVIRG